MLESWYFFALRPVLVAVNPMLLFCMDRIIGLTLVLMSMSVAAFATPVQTPEIDASTGASALALLSGGLLVLRSRRNKK